ncbi:hypothetical protein ABZ345_33280 [Lentzea sp. NPDC005914]|uniref:hypothetical protein n=1 Tax=Lentzea sp. NPDC005914 TaxID=3154572 RepID=UPI0033E1CAE9
MQNTRRHAGWLWGPVALALIALFVVSDYDLLSTRSTYFGLSKYSFASLGLPALAVVAGVWLTRHWQWLLTVGAVAVLAPVIEAQAHFVIYRPGATGIITSIGVAGTVLIVIGALAAAQDAALAALVVGAQVLATLFRGLDWLDNQAFHPAGLDLALALLAVVGGVLAVYGVRTGRTPQSEPMSRRAAVVGTAAAFLPIVLIAVGNLITLPPLPAAVIAGTVLVLCTAGLTLVLGRGALLKTAMAGFVLFAVSAPANIGIYFAGSQLTTYGSAAVIGLGIGILGAHLGRSAVVAAVACTVLAVVMWTSVEVTGRYDDTVQGGLGSLIIALAVAAVTSSAATAANAVTKLHALPVAIGPLLLAFALGFRAVVQLFLAYDKVPHELPEGDYISLWATLLGVAAVALTAIALLDFNRGRSPAATSR